MRYINGTLKFCRGRNLRVTVPSSASRDDISVTKAVPIKHANHDKNLIRDDLRYTLLYPDGTEVKTLPGSSIVSRGEWLGRPANFKGQGYCSILQRSRDRLRAKVFSR